MVNRELFKYGLEVTIELRKHTLALLPDEFEEPFGMDGNIKSFLFTA